LNPLIHGGLFARVFFLLLAVENRVMIHKTVSDTGNQELFNAENLYALTEDSVDVLILGSSQVAFGVSPVEMYDHSGISAYSIGMSQASMLSNYHWMLEFYKKQSPSVIMLDVSTLFESSLENSERISADVMRLSLNKLALSKAATDLHEESILSFVVPLAKYHSRWYSLLAQDFGDYDNDYCYRGLNITDKCKKGLSYDTLIIDNDDPDADVRELYDYQLEYFEINVANCLEKDIELVLFKTPKSTWIGSDSAQVQELADSYGLTYLDFNWEELLNAIGLNINTDMKDKDHLNTSGADKLSDYLADYATAHYDLPDRREDADYDLQINRTLYDTERTDAYLCATTDPLEWLALLKEHSACDIFLSTYGDTAGLVSDELAALLADLGLETDLNELPEGNGFVAWLTNDGTSVEEQTDAKYIRIEGTLDNGVSYQVVSRNQSSRKQSKQLIGGEDQSINTAGLNITLYDEATGTIIETVAIDLETGEMTCVTRSD
ncbi:MAG: hypothetical protein LUF68_01395, partial [Clostridiales bacterium]|nr:hypothetical protein [Clostridiales bacterium]